jgi:acyl carrier protein
MEKAESEARQFITSYLSQKLQDPGLVAEKLDAAGNLIRAGIIDSMGFLMLLAALEARFKLSLDFGDLDPEEFTTLKGLAHHTGRFISPQKGD